MTLVLTLAYAFLIAYCIVRLSRIFLFQRTRQSFLKRVNQQHLPKGLARKSHLIGFFHPYCHAGGGGERVLWTAVRAVQVAFPYVHCVIYTGDMDADPSEILQRAQQRFGVELPAPVDFIYLHQRDWVEASRYPRFTLLFQSLASLLLGWEALWQLVPDIYFDTMGYAFTYPLFKGLTGCTVLAYVHYPIISTDMLQVVRDRKAAHNNDAQISGNPILSRMKLIYYQLFAAWYGHVGSYADHVMVNSTWTRGHIQALWKNPQCTSVLFPPCDTQSLLELPLEPRDPIVLSVAQFRPEKRHDLQLRSFHDYHCRTFWKSDVKLVLIGGCRNAKDEAWVDQLRQLAEELDLQDRVEFKLNLSYTDLQRELGRATIGVHSMWNEHFGIGVVELMASGVIPVAHRSGGPLLDIVIPYEDRPTGFLAESLEEYGDAFLRIFNMTASERRRIQMDARRVSMRFSENAFETKLLEILRPFIHSG